MAVFTILDAEGDELGAAQRSGEPHEQQAISGVAAASQGGRRQDDRGRHEPTGRHHHSR